MKLIARTRWEYYVASVAGILAMTGLFVWCLTRVIGSNGVDFRSLLFWLAVVIFFFIPYALIGFFSSMKSVEVTKEGLIISYVFQKHRNVIRFSDISDMKAVISENEKAKKTKAVRDTFKLTLSDGRMFEFDRSQFNGYAQLKATCWRYFRK